MQKYQIDSLQLTRDLKMQRVEGFFQSFDMFSAPATLRAKGSSSITRTSAGVISFVLFCYFAYIFVFGMYKIFSFESISSSQTFQKLSLTKLTAQNFMFGIGNFRIDPKQFSSSFDIKTIIRSNKDGIIENVTMDKCNPQQWKKLGQDYVQQFNLHYLERFLCPTQPEKLKLINSSLVQNATYFQILIQPKDSSNSQYRKLLKNLLQTETNKFNLFYLDEAVIPNQQDPVQYFININNFAFISPFKAHKSLIRLSNFQVNTDFSLLPLITNVQTVKGLIIADTVLTSIDSDLQSERSTITFQLNNDLFKYSRKVGKIDEMFSYAGGLFALVIWCLAFFVSSFNKYRYQLMVAESTFNFDRDGHKIRQTQFNFWKYIKYSTYTWIQSYFCYKPKWEDCRKIQATIIQANHQMDVTRLFRKLQFLQMALIHTQDQDQNLIIALTEPRSLQQVKQERLILEYYFKIIQGQPAATAQDALNGHAEMFSNLEENIKSSQFLSKSSKSMNSSNIDPILQDPEQIKSKLMQYLNLRQNQALCQAISQFPMALKQAKEINLSSQLVQTEEHLTKSFLKLKPEVKTRLIKKIPLKIIHRLCIRSQILENNKIMILKQVDIAES